MTMRVMPTMAVASSLYVAAVFGGTLLLGACANGNSQDLVRPAVELDERYCNTFSAAQREAFRTDYAIVADSGPATRGQRREVTCGERE